MRTNKKLTKEEVDKMTDEEKAEEFKKSPEWASIKKSLDEQKAKSAEIGFDISKHWQDMQDSIEDENKKDE